MDSFLEPVCTTILDLEIYEQERLVISRGNSKDRTLDKKLFLL